MTIDDKARCIREAISDAIAFIEEQYPAWVAWSEDSTGAEAQRIVSALTVAISRVRELQRLAARGDAILGPLP